MPLEFTNLKNLYSLTLGQNQLSGEIPKELGNLKKVKYFNLAYNELTGSIHPELGNLHNVEELQVYYNNLSGQIPAELFNLTNLKYLMLSGNNLTGIISPDFGKLKKLVTLCLDQNQLSGNIPSEIGELTELSRLDLSINQLEGEIPESFNNLTNLITKRENGNGSYFDIWLWHNKLSGKVPSLFYDHVGWKDAWWNIMGDNKYNLAEVYVLAPTFHVTDINGAILDSKEIYPNHKYTAIFHWATWCGFSIAYMPEVIRLYKKYRDFGFEVIGLTSEEELSTISTYIKDNEIEWPNFFSTPSNMLDYPASCITPGVGYAAGSTPEITLIDSNGRVVFTSVITNRYELASFLEEKLGEGKQVEYYTSTDYSQDGKVKMLQTATKGDKAINIVLIGEGFVDKDMNDGGKYDLKMNEAIENFFAEQPITALREYFNVYAVKAISPNAEFFNNSKHAINEDNNKAFE